MRGIQNKVKVESTKTQIDHADSVGKLLSQLQLVSRVPVTYNGKPTRAIDRPGGPGSTTKWVWHYDIPTEFYVSPAIMRGFECKLGCTACCLPFTLDYTPEEWAQGWEGTQDVERFEVREVLVNDKKFPVYSYPQYQDPQCPYLAPVREGGALGCTFWGKGAGPPVGCASAPQILFTSRGAEVSMLTSKIFGRGWKWDNPAQCIFHPVADKLSAIPADADNQCHERADLLRRFLHWAEYLGLDTVLPQAIDAVEHLPDILKEHGMKTYRYA